MNGRWKGLPAATNQRERGIDFVTADHAVVDWHNASRAPFVETNFMSLSIGMKLDTRTRAKRPGRSVYRDLALRLDSTDANKRIQHNLAFCFELCGVGHVLKIAAAAATVPGTRSISPT